MAIILCCKSSYNAFNILWQLCELKHYPKTGVGDLLSSFNVKSKDAIFICICLLLFVAFLLLSLLLLFLFKLLLFSMLLHLHLYALLIPKLLLLLFGWFGSKVWEKAISSQTNDGEHKKHNKHKKGESKTFWSKTMMKLMMMTRMMTIVTMLTIAMFLNRRKCRTYWYFAWKWWNKTSAQNLRTADAFLSLGRTGKSFAHHQMNGNKDQSSDEKKYRSATK